MNHSSWVQISFEAGHKLIPCNGMVDPHGHRYLVRGFIERKYDPIIPPKLDELRDKMTEIRNELHGAIIDDMLPGVATTPGGIAAYLLERLMLCDAVEVRPDESTSVTLYRKESGNG